jgi:hypothetical protein
MIFLSRPASEEFTQWEAVACVSMYAYIAGKYPTMYVAIMTLKLRRLRSSPYVHLALLVHNLRRLQIGRLLQIAVDSSPLQQGKQKYIETHDNNDNAFFYENLPFVVHVSSMNIRLVVNMPSITLEADLSCCSMTFITARTLTRPIIKAGQLPMLT